MILRIPQAYAKCAKYALNDITLLDGVQSFCIIGYVEAKWVSECDQALLLIANNIPTHHSSVQKLRTHVFKLGK